MAKRNNRDADHGNVHTLFFLLTFSIFQGCADEPQLIHGVALKNLSTFVKISDNEKATAYVSDNENLKVFLVTGDNKSEHPDISVGQMFGALNSMLSELMALDVKLKPVDNTNGKQQYTGTFTTFNDDLRLGRDIYFMTEWFPNDDTSTMVLMMTKNDKKLRDKLHITFNQIKYIEKVKSNI